MQEEGPVPIYSDVYPFIAPDQYFGRSDSESQSSLRPLHGSTALVTGAGRGIGRTIAITLAAAGADVICVSRTKAELDEVVAYINERDDENENNTFANGRGSARAWAVVADLSQPGAAYGIRAAVATIGSDHEDQVADEHDNDDDGRQRQQHEQNEQQQPPTFKFVDILINNAAIDRINPFYLEHWPWTNVISTNLLGPVQLIHAFLPGMMARNRGTIISLGSRNAGHSVFYMTAYSASKAALTRFHHDLDLELRDRNDLRRSEVRSNVLGRGGFHSDDEVHNSDEEVRTGNSHGKIGNSVRGVVNGIATFVVHPGDVPTTIAHVPGAINMTAVREVAGMRDMLNSTKGCATETPELVAWTIVKLITDRRARSVLSGKYVDAVQDLEVVLQRAERGELERRRLYVLKIDEL
ncbi:hypothetical protein HRR78_004730 [Exophiala dermatitidis]|nr:hypothetical protein HRR75_000199 [Exophiala dermatitidis]KAJ4549919.1 hypothetical protein HRR78_004730 [Exophiala dermatitidis]